MGNNIEIDKNKKIEEEEAKKKAEEKLKKEEEAKKKAFKKAQAESKFILNDENIKPLLYKGKKILKKYKEGKFTVIETEDGAVYKNI